VGATVVPLRCYCGALTNHRAQVISSYRGVGRFLIGLCDLVGAPRGRTGLFSRLPGRGGYLVGGPATKWGGRGGGGWGVVSNEKAGTGPSPPAGAPTPARASQKLAPRRPPPPHAAQTENNEKTKRQKKIAT
jgi:hypothetical protein